MKQTMKSYMRHLGAWTLMMGAASFSTQQLLAGPEDVDYSYSGEATGIYLSNLPETNSSPTIVAHAGPLESFGGKDDDHADHVDLYDDAVTCDHADAHVDGTGDHSDSHAHVAHFVIEFTGSDGSMNTVEADDVDAHATVHHHPGKGPDDEEMGPGDKGPDHDEMGPGNEGPGDEEMGPGDEGPGEHGDEDSDVEADSHVHVHGLVVNGERIHTEDNERQVLTFSGFKLIINDQSESESDDEGQATATGIQIVVSDSVYADVGQAEADLVAEEAGESDVVSGSGTFTDSSSGDTDVFSFSGGPNGSLIFGDQTAGVNVVATGLTSVTQVNATTEQLVYSCLINGVAGTATVVAQDVGGLFGAGDAFSITLSTGFTASGTLNSGEIVLLN